MPFRVFISHSTQDPEIVYTLYNLLRQRGIEAYVAEYYPEPGRPLPQKVLENIMASNLVLVILTRYGARSASVNQEVGAAIANRKRIIPLVEAGVDVGVLLQGIEYVPLDVSDPVGTLDNVASYVKQIEIKDAEQARAAFIVFLIFFGLLLAAASGK